LATGFDDIGNLASVVATSTYLQFNPFADTSKINQEIDMPHLKPYS
jgi:hypothetical protein